MVNNPTVTFDLKDMGPRLEYIVSEGHNPTYTSQRFVTISEEEAKKRFEKKPGRTSIYIPTGGQKGDEGKGRFTQLFERTDKIKWQLMNATHNTGASGMTQNESGEWTRFAVHICPPGITNPSMKNYIGDHARVNPFSLEQEIRKVQAASGRHILQKEEGDSGNYHLMVDSRADLVVPVNRASDVVCRPAMETTVSGATESLGYSTRKKAPTLMDAMYDPVEFIGKVNKQIREFNDSLQHDEVFVALGINNMHRLGTALADPNRRRHDERLEVLARKLSKEEIAFFAAEDPAEYLLEQYRAIFAKDLFNIGDVKKATDDHLERGEAGILKNSQSVLLSGPTKYSKNKTAGDTSSHGVIKAAGLAPEEVDYRRLLVSKFGNTSVGGCVDTMSGMIYLDRLSQLYAKTGEGEYQNLALTKTLEDFMEEDAIKAAYKEVTKQLFTAMKEEKSLENSTVTIEGLDVYIQEGEEYVQHALSLIEAHKLLTAYVMGETGETSGRSRIWRLDDEVETGVVRKIEGKCMQGWSALDRGMEVPEIGIISSYRVVDEYGPYSPGTTIKPGDELLTEHLTCEACIPIISFMPSWDSIFADGTNDRGKGKELHPNLSEYLSRKAVSGEVVAITFGKKHDKVMYVKAA